MENKKAQPSTQKISFLDFWKKNVVFTTTLGLVPLVIGTVTLRTAAAFAFLFLILMMGTSLVASILHLNLPEHFRIPVYAVVASLWFIPAWFLLPIFFPTFKDMMGIYLYVGVVDMLVISRADQFARNAGIKNAIFGIFIDWIGFALVLLVGGAIREILAYGTLWGHKLYDFQIPGVARPFFGFILIGMLGAAYSAIHSSITEPKRRAPRKGRQKHRTLTEEILDTKGKDELVATVDNTQQDVPAAFRQAHAEAHHKKRLKTKNTVETQQQLTIESKIPVDMDQDTIEVLVVAASKEEQAFKKETVIKEVVADTSECIQENDHEEE